MESIVALAGGIAGRAMLRYALTDRCERASERLGVRSVPALVLFARGREVARRIGAGSAADLAAFADRALAEVDDRDGERTGDAGNAGASPPATAP
jgi:thioredoxin-like negative regulator of GroEL